MLRRMHQSMKSKDEGFTLIELLVVMIVIGILASIAIPVFLNQRDKALQAAMKSDARAIATQVASMVMEEPVPDQLSVTGVTGTFEIQAVLGGNGQIGNRITVTASRGVQIRGVQEYTLVNGVGVYCVTAEKQGDQSNAWSAGPNGLKRGATCP